MNKRFLSTPRTLPSTKTGLNAYSIGKTIGSGTFSKVKLGVHRASNKQVAIKVIDKAKFQTPGDTERIRREIKILHSIKHPNIAELYEVQETSSHLFLIMEHASGGELFNYIVQKKRLDNQESCRFFQQIISGVEYLHSLKIAHRDLKPENLLLDQNLQIKIIDFGLSNLYQNNELLQTACGSPCYAAPEMILGQKYSGLKADIWSCGVILYAMLCGFLPFEDTDTQKLYLKIVNGLFEVPGFLSESAVSLLHSLLNTCPMNRADIEDIKHCEWFHVVKPLKLYMKIDPPRRNSQRRILKTPRNDSTLRKRPHNLDIPDLGKQMKLKPKPPPEKPKENYLNPIRNFAKTMSPDSKTPKPMRRNIPPKISSPQGNISFNSSFKRRIFRKKLLQ